MLRHNWLVSSSRRKITIRTLSRFWSLGQSMRYADPTGIAGDVSSFMEMIIPILLLQFSHHLEDIVVEKREWCKYSERSMGESLSVTRLTPSTKPLFQRVEAQKRKSKKEPAFPPSCRYLMHTKPSFASEWLFICYAWRYLWPVLRGRRDHSWGHHFRNRWESKSCYGRVQAAQWPNSAFRALLKNNPYNLTISSLSWQANKTEYWALKKDVFDELKAKIAPEDILTRVCQHQQHSCSKAE